MHLQPAKPTALRIPFWFVLNFKSHSDTGSIKLIANVSIRDVDKTIPEIIIKKQLNFPNSTKKER